jgi:hypothetical protein
MDKKTKMWIGVAAVGVVALWLYNKNKTSTTTSFIGGVKSLSSLSIGKSTVSICKSGGPGSNDPCNGAAENICGESCLNGRCNVRVYDENSNVYFVSQSCPKVPSTIPAGAF